jgi:hypothetical protein
MLDAFAARIGGAADGTERRVEIGDGFRRQTTRPFLRRADHAVDFGRLDGVPLAGAQAVGRRMLRDCDKNHRGECAAGR